MAKRPSKRSRSSSSSSSASPRRRPDDQLASLVEEFPDLHYVYSVHAGRLTFVSPAVEKMTGYSRADFESRSRLPCDIVDPEYRPKLEAMTAGESSAAELILKCRHRNGSTVWTDHRNIFVRDDKGRLTQVIGSARDITGRITFDLGLRESEDRFRHIVGHLPNGVLVADLDGKTTYVNNRMVQMLGHPADRIVGRPFFDFVDEGTKAEAPAFLARRRQGIAEQQDLTFQRRDGSDVWTIVSLHPLHGLGGDLLGFVAIVTDLGSVRLSHGPVEMDLTQLRVVENGQEVGLTVKEFLLLRSLIQHRGRPVSREQLIKEVWGVEQPTRERTVDVHISHLRKKLRTLANSIRSVGAAGYLLTDPAEEEGV